jgi:hypothetical protein
MLCVASAPRIVPIRAESRIILAPMGRGGQGPQPACRCALAQPLRPSPSPQHNASAVGPSAPLRSQSRPDARGVPVLRSLDPGINILRYVTLCNGRDRAVSLAHPAVRPTPQRPRGTTAGASSAVRVRPDCLVAGAARGAGADEVGMSSAALSPTPAPRRAVRSR